MRISLGQKIIGGCTAAFLLIAVISGAAYWGTLQTARSSDRIDMSNERLLLLEHTFSDLKDVESGARGYVITGDDRYLEPYYAADDDVGSDVQELREMLAGHPDQQTSIDEVAGLVAKQVALTDNVIALRRNEGFEAAQQFILTGESKQVMDGARAAVTRMEDHEKEHLTQVSAESRAVARRTRYIMLGGTALVLVVAVLAIVSIQRQIAARQRAVYDLDRFFAVAPELLATADFNGYFTRLNPRWSDTLGWTVEELLREPYLNFVHPDDRGPTLAAAARQTAEGKAVLSFSNRYRCKDGSYRWLQWSSAPLQDRLFAVARDITAIRETEHALRDSEARHRSVIDNIVDGVIVIDQQGRVESFNEAAERIFGYAASEVVGQNVKMLMPEPYHDEHDQYLHNYISGGSKKIIGIGREVEGRRKDGEHFPLDLAVSEIVQGDRRAFVGITRDISDRKRAENALRNLNETLEERVAERTAVAEQRTEELVKINGELEAFTYSVSHDLKEPLRTLEAFSGFLLEDYADRLDDEGRDYLTKLGKASSRMKHLIEDLLALSRIGRVAQPPVPTDVHGIASAVVEGMRATLDECHASVEVADDIPSVLADPTRIEQIFGNLIGNGVKFNQSDAPRVTVGVRGLEEGQVVLYVRDNGIGIDPRYHERIFGIFQRLHRREEYEGTGAGLAIVKRAVETLGGRIWVESEPGVGTTFLFTLPLATGERGSERIAA